MRERHPLAGKTVKLKLRSTSDVDKKIDGQEYRVEDWVDNKSKGMPWYECDNFAVLNYSLRQQGSEIPYDRDVVYGHVDGLGYCVHDSELGEVLEAAK